jgi:hypothetical protein
MSKRSRRNKRKREAIERECQKIQAELRAISGTPYGSDVTSEMAYRQALWRRLDRLIAIRDRDKAANP